MLKEFTKSLEQMEVSFKSDAKSVKKCSDNLEVLLLDLKNKSQENKILEPNELENTIKLIEKLSILNEYKLNLFKDFSIYNIQKK